MDSNTTNIPTYPPLELMPHQGNQVLRLVEILQTRLVAGTRSKPGYGKTYEALALACLFNLKVLWIGHPTTVEFVNSLFKKHGVKIVKFLSYQQLSGTCNGTKHDYLDRRSSDSSKFKVTKKLRRLVDRGVMIVFDEIQFAGQINSARYNAVLSIINYLRKIQMKGKPCKSRCLIVSGTHFDHVDANKAIGICHLLSITTPSTSTTTNSTKNKKEIYDEETIQKLVNECVTINPNHDLFSDCSSITMTKANLVCLFKEVVMPHYIPTSESPRVECVRHVSNMMISVKNSEMPFILQGYKELVLSTQYDCNNRTVVLSGKTEGGMIRKHITQARTTFELSMVDPLVRVVRNSLSSNQYHKFCLLVSTPEAAKELFCRLSDLNPLLVTTKVSVQERQRRIDLFQKNDIQEDVRNQHPIFVGTIGTVGIGSSLDDNDGGRPRQVFLMPAPNLQQAEWRTCRASTKSDTWIHTVFPRQLPQLLPLFDAMIKKTIGVKTDDTYTSLLDQEQVVAYETDEEAESISDEELNEYVYPKPIKRRAAIDADKKTSKMTVPRQSK